MAETWPATLPLPMLPIAGQSPVGALFTQNDVGPALSRVVTTAASKAVSFRLVLSSPEQFVIFEDFFADDLRYGAVPALLDANETDDTREVRIRSYRWQDLGAGRYEVICEAEILPDAS